MWWSNKFLSLAVLCLFLASCGFEPLYGTHQNSSAGGGTSPLSAVSIDTIPGLIGQQFKAQLEDRFNPTGTPVNASYGLAVSIKSTKIPVVFNADGTIARYDMQLNSSYRLYRKADGEKIKTGTINRTTSYDLSDADFSDFVAENDALRRALTELSEDYRLRLAAYLRSAEGRL